MIKSLWKRFGYRRWAKLLHAMNLHHTSSIGPMEDGSYVVKCEWCGISKMERTGRKHTIA